MSAQYKVDDFVKSINELTAALNKILDEAKTNLTKYGLDEFMKNKIGGMFKLTTAYVDCYNRLFITEKARLNEIAKSLYRSMDVQEVVGRLDESERTWDSFLNDVDGKLENNDLTAAPDTTKDPLSTTPDPKLLCVPLVDASNRETVTIGDLSALKPLVLVLLRHFA